MKMMVNKEEKMKVKNKEDENRCYESKGKKKLSMMNKEENTRLSQYHNVSKKV